MLVTYLIKVAAIALLRTVETKERVKILLTTLRDITRWPWQLYDTHLKVEVAFDLYNPIRPADIISIATSVAKSPNKKEYLDLLSII